MVGLGMWSGWSRGILLLGEDGEGLRRDQVETRVIGCEFCCISGDLVRLMISSVVIFAVAVPRSFLNLVGCLHDGAITY